MSSINLEISISHSLIGMLNALCWCIYDNYCVISFLYQTFKGVLLTFLLTRRSCSDVAIASKRLRMRRCSLSFHHSLESHNTFIILWVRWQIVTGIKRAKCKWRSVTADVDYNLTLCGLLFIDQTTYLSAPRGTVAFCFRTMAFHFAYLILVAICQLTAVFSVEV